MNRTLNTMKFLMLLILTTAINQAHSQATFIIDDFSKDYYGKLYISDTADVFSEGWIAVYNRKTKKQLIKINSEELTFTLREGKVKSNIKELPYGEQSQLIYEDFNFDGRNDLALMDGQNSCYHGPSFQIYLATDNGFKHSAEFTRLAQEYCGMFSVDAQSKRINTMTKSGCCWHQFSEFIVENNKPVAVKILEEGLNPNGIMWDYTEYNRINGKMVEKYYSLLNIENEKDVIYYFEFSNGKAMRLLKQNDLLNYVFTDKGSKVELFYADTFYYSKNENAIWFTNNKTTYKINATGMQVSMPNNKTINMNAKPGTQKGLISDLQNTKFENVVEE